MDDRKLMVIVHSAPIKSLERHSAINVDTTIFHEASTLKTYLLYLLLCCFFGFGVAECVWGGIKVGIKKDEQFE